MKSISSVASLFLPLLLVLPACSDGGGGSEPEPEPEAGESLPWSFLELRRDQDAGLAVLSGISALIDGATLWPGAVEVCRPAGSDADACGAILPGSSCEGGGGAVTLDGAAVTIVVKLPLGAELSEGDQAQAHVCMGDPEGLTLHVGVEADPDSKHWQPLVFEEAGLDKVLAGTAPALPAVAPAAPETP